MAHSVRRIIIIIRRTFTFTVSKITVILYIRRNRRSGRDEIVEYSSWGI